MGNSSQIVSEVVADLLLKTLLMVSTWLELLNSQIFLLTNPGRRFALSIQVTKMAILIFQVCPQQMDTVLMAPLNCGTLTVMDMELIVPEPSELLEIITLVLTV